MLSLKPVGVAQSHFTRFCSHELDLDPMTLIHEHDLTILKMYTPWSLPEMNLLDQSFRKLSTRLETYHKLLYNTIQYDNNTTDYCFADRTTTHTTGNSSTDTSLIRDIYCGPKVLFETCVAMKSVNDDDDDDNR